ncbi:MAG: hypothetical protein LH610_08565, partial [Sphingomonas bacterium]|nr:hypothetical protein [Sphingomonas bacterium]
MSIHLTSRRRRRARRPMLSGHWLAAPLLAAATMLVISLILAPAMTLVSRIGLAFGAGLVPVSLLPIAGQWARRSRLTTWGAAIAHLGGALALIGIASATGFISESRIVARAGERIDIGPWLIEYIAAVPVAGPDFTAIETELRATRGNGVTVLRPQLRTAISPPAESSSPAGVTVWNGRLSTKPGKGWGDGREILVSWTPFITLLWFGGGMMAIGGLIALAGLRGVWPALAAAALTAGGAGYELFVRSDGSGSLPSATTAYARTSLVEQRGAFLGQFHRSSHWLIISDSYAARGQTRDAVAILQAA